MGKQYPSSMGCIDLPTYHLRRSPGIVVEGGETSAEAADSTSWRPGCISFSMMFHRDNDNDDDEDILEPYPASSCTKRTTGKFFDYLGIEEYQIPTFCASMSSVLFTPPSEGGPCDSTTQCSSSSNGSGWGNAMAKSGSEAAAKIIDINDTRKVVDTLIERTVEKFDWDLAKEYQGAKEDSNSGRSRRHRRRRNSKENEQFENQYQKEKKKVLKKYYDKQNNISERNMTIKKYYDREKAEMLDGKDIKSGMKYNNIKNIRGKKKQIEDEPIKKVRFADQRHTEVKEHYEYLQA